MQLVPKTMAPTTPANRVRVLVLYGTGIMGIPRRYSQFGILIARYYS